MASPNQERDLESGIVTSSNGKAETQGVGIAPDDQEQQQRNVEAGQVETEGSSSTSNAAVVDKEQPAKPAPVTLEWSGPDDPGNPINWPEPKRWATLLTVTFLILAVTIGSSIYVPAVEEIAAEFNVSMTAAITPFTTFVLGLSFGPIISAPLSEKYGRRVVYLIFMVLFALFVMGVGLSKNFGSIVVLRFFAGLFGSPPVAVAAGSAADFSTPANRGATISVVAVAALAGPSLGPLIGAFVVVQKGWQWTQWVTLMFIGVALIGTLLTGETYKRTILLARAKKNGDPLPPKPNGLKAMQFFLLVTLIRPVHMLLFEPIVTFLSLYVAFFFGTIYSFFVAFPYVFATVYGFTPEQQGLTFLSIIIGSMIGALINFACDRWIYQPAYRLHQADPTHKLVPELRLYPAMIAGVLAPIGLFWFAWTTTASIHWICPLIAAVLVGAANVGIFVSIIMYFIDTYAALLAASAMAANGILRYILGAVFPLFTIQMYERLDVHWASTLLAFLSLVLLPIPMVCFAFGHHIRLRSRYQTTHV